MYLPSLRDCLLKRLKIQNVYFYWGMYRFSSNNSSTFVKVLLEHRHGDRTTVISPDYCILTDDTFRRHVVRSMTYSTMSVMLKGTYTREISKRKVTSVLRRQDHKQLLVFWIPRVNFSTRHRLHVWRVKGNCDVWWLKTRPGEFRKTWDVDTSHKNELRLYVSAYFVLFSPSVRMTQKHGRLIPRQLVREIWMGTTHRYYRI